MPYDLSTTTRGGKKMWCMKSKVTKKKYCFKSKEARGKSIKLHEMFYAREGK